MSTCLDCKFANWKRTAAGGLHPSGKGDCGHVWVAPPISAAFTFGYGNSREPPRPTWGQIERKKPHQTTGEKACKVFEPREDGA